ncbi:MAG TPA: outer membrane lipoprotein carrier protein LolA, partial [Marinobacter hydrocarbonoclasticus]|nr:outer membrane lipoprotein carrier protein LolA [Marinobacter nauticus]
MIRMFSGILLVLAATWSGVSQADSAQASRGAAEQLTSILKSYETYQADFIQIVVNENGSQVQETRGSLKAKRPGLFYWETGAPLSQFIVSD